MREFVSMRHTDNNIYGPQPAVKLPVLHR